MDLPLFPLNTVLYPGSHLDLRIFEPRYLDMVRDCMRAQTGFGVCLIIGGQEVGTPAIPAAMGTEAHIVDFCSLPDGLLGITVQGRTRFRASQVRALDSGLIVARPERIPAEAPRPVPAQYGVLVTILERLADQDDAELVRADKASYDDAGWVGFRLADRLPVSLLERQQVLETEDPIARLDLLAHWLPRFQKE
jgi:uncharacterized protein